MEIKEIMYSRLHRGAFQLAAISLDKHATASSSILAICVTGSTIAVRGETSICVTIISKFGESYWDLCIHTHKYHHLSGSS